jgi:hypothetical protein
VSDFDRKEVYPVSTDVLEESMTDATTDVDRSQETQISAEYLVQLRELAESQGWSLDGTLRRALAVTRAVLQGNTDPRSKVYVYRNGKQYSMTLH